MNVIEVKNLSKTFKVKIKEKGLKGSLKSIFKLLAPEVKGVILNPQSVQIMVTREVINKEK